MFHRLGPWEIVLILAIVLILFGVGKLPQVGHALGKGLRSFKKGQSGEPDDEKTVTSRAAKS
jgi:sec-independent protein translocase protein TatA